jgi:sugar/nucleoside kinase (ribokinase family)
MLPGIYLTGNVVADTLVRPVEGMPRWGTTTYVESISVHLGGNGAGSAYAVAMMGVPAKLAGAIGDDPPGAFVTGRLRSAGVEISQMRVLDKTATAVTVGLVHSGGERLFFHELGASGLLQLDDIPFSSEVVAGYSFFHYASIFCLPALRPQASEVLERARRAGLRTSLDLDWDTSGRWFDDLGPLCPLIEFLFLNAQEAQMLCGLEEPEAVGLFFLDRGVQTVVFKMGAKGCAVFTRDDEFRVPAYVVQVVDTTGAGDCFCGGFLAGLCRGFSLRESARLANAVAAHGVQQMGNTDGVADYETTRRWMESVDHSQA